MTFTEAWRERVEGKQDYHYKGDPELFIEQDTGYGGYPQYLQIQKACRRKKSV